MGVDAADISNSGWQDLFVANVDQEMFSVYRNNKNETFTDVAHVHGVAQATNFSAVGASSILIMTNDGRKRT